MKPHRISACLALLSMLWIGAAPAWGVSKEMVQLQTQVQQLQEQMTAGEERNQDAFDDDILADDDFGNAFADSSDERLGRLCGGNFHQAVQPPSTVTTAPVM